MPPVHDITLAKRKMYQKHKLFDRDRVHLEDELAE